jgi:succinoglycan biosynthesis transport protein ExoP
MALPAGAQPGDPLYGLGARGHASPASAQGGVMIAFAAMRRRWLVVASLAILGALAGLAAGLALTPKYAATASVLIGAPRPQFAELEQLVGGLPLSKDTVANEIELLQSRHLAKKVIAELELQRLPEFNPALGEGGLGAAIRDAKAQVKLWLSAAAAEVGLPYGAGDSSAILAERDELESVVDTFLKQLHVTIRGPSQVLDVTVKSMEPELAAVAANSLARHYLVDRAAAHTDAATRASDWFQGRLKELEAQFAQREAAVEAFREQHGLLEGAKGPLRAEQVSLLSEQLLEARSLLGQAQARHQAAIAAARTGSGRGLADMLNSVTVQDLRREESVLQAEVAELRRSLGPRHPQMVDRERRLAAVRADLQAEAGRVVSSLAAEVEVQQQRVNELDAALQRLEQRMHDEGVAEGKLRVMEREAEAARTLYEEALKRVESSAPAAKVEASDGRVISEAVVPLAPSTPSPVLLGVLGLLFGCFGGSAAAFGLELRDHRFRTALEAAEQMHLPVVGVVPALRCLRGAQARRTPEDQVVAQPNGPFAEVIRTVRNRLLLSMGDRRPQRILITSSIKGEGKTTLAIALGRSLANSGREVLLIDGDLRLGRVEAAFGGRDLPGLSDYLLGRAGLQDIVATDPLSGLRFMPAGSHTRHTGDLLHSRRLAELFELSESPYDVVIIDSPPILPVADASNFVRHADMILLVVDWTQMRPDIVEAGAARLREMAFGAAVGTIVNNIDLRRQASEGFPELQVYYRRRYHSSSYYAKS